MKRYMSVLQIFNQFAFTKNLQDCPEDNLNHETEKSASTSKNNPQLDVPTFIRQGRVLSIHQ